MRLGLALLAVFHGSLAVDLGSISTAELERELRRRAQTVEVDVDALAPVGFTFAEDEDTADAERAYLEEGAPAVDFLMSVLKKTSQKLVNERTEPGQEYGQMGRIMLLSFPNSGTSITLKISECVTGRPFCTAYNRECDDPARGGGRGGGDGGAGCIDECGNGAFQIAPLPEDHSEIRSNSALIKNHAFGYASNPGGLRTGNAFINNVDQSFNDVDSPIQGALRLVRNPYDNLVGRFHHVCRRGDTCDSRNSFLTDKVNMTPSRLGARYQELTPLVPPSLPVSQIRIYPNLKDLCIYLHWHHRGVILAESNLVPMGIIEYEHLYVNPEGFLETLMGALGVDGDVNDMPDDCTSSIKPRDIVSLDGQAMPTYLHMYDGKTVRRVAKMIRRYLSLSRNFTTPDLIDCDYCAAED